MKGPLMQLEPLTREQQEMVQANMGLVGFALNRRRTPEAEWDDAFQDGLVGLMRASQKFDPAKGFAFSTYALYWIRAGIQKGRRVAEGKSFRQAIDAGEEWDPPLSMDWQLVPEFGDGLTFADVLPAPGDVADEAIGNVCADRISGAVGMHCRDDLDRAVVEASLGGVAMAQVGREHGVSAQTCLNRLEKIRAKLDHPVTRDRLIA